MKVLLIGNYLPDAQESMLRYAELLRAGLAETGVDVTLMTPRKFLGSATHPPEGMWKWIGYVDKYVLSPLSLRRAIVEGGFDVVHICDHANAVYIPARKTTPCIVTCHDLLAVRGALGEDTDCPASSAGLHLQRAILRGMGRADAICSVSTATRSDVERLLGSYCGLLDVVPLAPGFPYGELSAAVVDARLQPLGLRAHLREFVLHVGSNQRRKNRAGAIHALAAIASSWDGKLVFAGQALTPELAQLAQRLGVADRVVEVVKPSNELLEALYNAALALLFPSRFEGFGWPIIEAQACGCPVICSDRAPFPEVAGDSAILCDADDHAALGAAVVTLSGNAGLKESLSGRGRINAQRFGKRQMISRFLEIYGQVLSAERPAVAAA